MTVPNATATGVGLDNANKKVKKLAQITDCISEIHNTQIHNSKDTDVVMPMQHLIEYRDNYLKTLRSLQQNYIDEPALDDNGIITGFAAANNKSISFKYK